jgi:ABC-2 type transport system permease protein
MIKTIAQKEFTEMLRDGRFRWSAGALLLLLLAAAIIGWNQAQEIKRDREAAANMDKQTWEAQGNKNPHSAAHFGHYAFKPTTALSYVDHGLNPYLGVAIWLEAHYQNLSSHRPIEDKTALQRFGELTVAWTLQYLVPLLIILLAFSSFAGERERGTLRQLVSLGVPSRKLAFGKALGVSAALALVLIPATLLAAVLLAGLKTGESFGEAALRFITLSGSYLLYFAAILGLSLAVSAKVKSSRVALLTLIGFWMISSLLAPRLASDLSERLYPSPTVSAFWEAIFKDMREGIDGHNPSDQRRKQLEAKVLAQYNVKELKDLPVNFAGIALQEGEEYSNQIFDKHYSRLWALYEKQAGVQQLASVFSPLLAVRNVSMGLAGTDLHQHRHFAAQAEVHRRKIIKQLNGDMTQNAGNQDYDYLADPALWSKTPQFEYTPPSFDWVLEKQLGNLLILGLWCAATALIAVAAVGRVRVD